MTDDRGTIRSIAWRDLFPWLLIFRTFWLSLSLPLLFLATAGVLLQPIGWRLADAIFISDATLRERGDFAAVNEGLTRFPGSSYTPSSQIAHNHFERSLVRNLVPSVAGDYAGIFDRLSFPFVALFNNRLSIGMFAYFVFGALWTLALWSLIGGAITRVAVVYLGLEERTGIRDAVVFATRRYGSYFAAPLYPLLGALLLALPIMLLGLLFRSDVGVLIAGTFWIFALVAALGMAFLLVGMLFGWPLMAPAISAENGDAFEALSRSFGYTFQRPFHYLFYAVVATLFAALCWIIVANFASLVIDMGWWSAGWGAGRHELVGDVTIPREDHVRAVAAMSTQPPDVSDSLWYGTRLLNLWNGLVQAITWGFAHSLFFCLASAIYLLLRHVDDETEFDEVYLDDDEERFTLPDVKRDAAGVPTMSPGATTAPAPTPPPTDIAPSPPPGERPLSEEE